MSRPLLPFPQCASHSLTFTAPPTALQLLKLTKYLPSTRPSHTHSFSMGHISLLDCIPPVSCIFHVSAEILRLRRGLSQSPS